MSGQITHCNGLQIVSVDDLREVLAESGETCYCAPDKNLEWDAGECPEHECDTAQ